MSLEQSSFINYLQDLVLQNKINKNIYSDFLKNLTIKNKSQNNDIKITVEFVQKQLKEYNIKLTPKKITNKVKHINSDLYQVQDDQFIFQYEGYVQLMQILYPNFNQQIVELNNLLITFITLTDKEQIQELTKNEETVVQKKQKYQKCQFEDCQQLGVYKNPTERKNKYCFQHKSEVMVKNYRVCQFENCVTEARFTNLESNKRLFCAKHKPNNSYRNASVKKQVLVTDEQEQPDGQLNDQEGIQQIIEQVIDQVIEQVNEQVNNQTTLSLHQE